jgi:hypothetical protein
VWSHHVAAGGQWVGAKSHGIAAGGQWVGRPSLAWLLEGQWVETITHSSIAAGETMGGETIHMA